MSLLGRCGRHLKKRAKETDRYILHTNGVRPRSKGNNRQTEEQSTLQVAAAVCGTSSIARLSLLGGLVPCYPVYRLCPAFVSYAPPPERMGWVGVG